MVITNEVRREDINQVYHLNKEYLKWSKKLEELETQRDSIKSSSNMELSGVRSGNVNKDAIGSIIADICDIEDIISGILANIQYEKKRLLKHIANVKDSQLRQILMHRCLDCKNWMQVGLEMNLTEDAVKKMFYRAYPK